MMIIIIITAKNGLIFSFWGGKVGSKKIFFSKEYISAVSGGGD